MDLGTGIFLGAVVISATLLILYSRVRIGRVLKWTAIVLVFVAATSAVLVFYFNTYSFHRSEINSLAGISLGDKFEDVRFRKGEHSEVCYMDGTKDRAMYSYSPNSDYDKTRMLVEAWEGKVVRITISDDLGYDNPSSTNPIYNGASENRIRKVWGNEDFIRVISPSTRHYVFRRFHFAVALRNNEAGAIIVFDPDYFYKSPEKGPDRKLDCYDKDGKQVKS